MTAISTPASTRIQVRNLSMVIRIRLAHLSYGTRLSRSCEVRPLCRRKRVQANLVAGRCPKTTIFKWQINST